MKGNRQIGIGSRLDEVETNRIRYIVDSTEGKMIKVTGRSGLKTRGKVIKK